MDPKPRDIFRRYVELSFAHPFLIVLAFAALGAGSFALTRQIAMRSSFVELLPEKAKEVQDLHLVAAKAGGDGYLVVQVKGAPLKDLRAFADAAAPKLEKLPEVRYVEYRYDIEFFAQRALLLLPTDKLKGLREDVQARIDYEKKKANPFFVDLLDEKPPLSFDEVEKKYSPDAPKSEYLESKDGSELYLFVKPNGTAADLDYSKRLVANVTTVCNEVARGFPGISTATSGAYRIRLEEDEVMRADVVKSIVLSTLISLLVIFFSARRISSLIVVMAPMSVGISCTIALAKLTIGHLNIVTSFLVAIIIGLGVEYGIHLSMRYWEERGTLGAVDAMTESVRGTFNGALTSALTNAAAFFVLIFARFHAFQEFGWLSGTGVFLTLTMSYLVCPAMLAIAERIRPIKPLPQEKVLELSTRKYRRWPTGLVAGICLAIIGFAGYSVAVAKDLSFESDMRKLKGDSPATRLDDHIAQQLGVKITPAILYVDDLDQARKVQAQIEDVRRAHGPDTAFDRVASITDLVPTDTEARLAEIKKFGDVLHDLPKGLSEGPYAKRIDDFKRMLDVKPWGLSQLPLEIRRRFESLDGKGIFVLLFPRYSLYDVKEIHAWATQIDEVVQGAKQEGVEVHVLDGNIIADRILSLVRGDGPYILWSAALVVFAMIFVSLRSLKRTAMVAGPLFLGMVCLAGGMHLFGVNLNFINAVVLPNLLAIAVDNSVHLFHRYEEEGPGSLGHILRHTGFAAVVATITNASGYGALLIASHQGLRSMGQLAVLGVSCTFMGTTIFFPAMLALAERWRKPSAGSGSGAGSSESTRSASAA